MTRRSIQEYAAALRQRYQQATKKQKGALLDEFCRTTGYHRKAAIRLLRGTPAKAVSRRGPRRTFGPEVAWALKELWEASDHICSSPESSLRQASEALPAGAASQFGAPR